MNLKHSPKANSEEKPIPKDPNIPRLIAIASTLISLPVMALIVVTLIKGCPAP